MQLELIPQRAGLYFIIEVRQGKRNRRVAKVERSRCPSNGWNRSWLVTWNNKVLQEFRVLADLNDSVRFVNRNTSYMDVLTRDRFDSYKNER